MDPSRIELESCRRERHILPLYYEPKMGLGGIEPPLQGPRPCVLSAKL